jgi:hypothetical protein
MQVRFWLQSGRVPHLRRSGSFSIDAPALPGWAMFGRSALRALVLSYWAERGRLI